MFEFYGYWRSVYCAKRNLKHITTDNIDCLITVTVFSLYQIIVAGGLAVGIPGEIRGLWLAHQISGKLPWKDLFQPTIKMCSEGFPVGIPLATAMSEQGETIKKHQGLRYMYLKKITIRKYYCTLYFIEATTLTRHRSKLSNDKFKKIIWNIYNRNTINIIHTFIINIWKPNAIACKVLYSCSGFREIV